jgi:hypothetical protein
MRQRIFQYAVLLHNYNADGEYVDSKMIVEPKFQLAKSEKELVFNVTREIPADAASNPDNIEIIIRNF